MLSRQSKEALKTLCKTVTSLFGAESIALKASLSVILERRYAPMFVSIEVYCDKLNVVLNHRRVR